LHCSRLYARWNNKSVDKHTTLMMTTIRPACFPNDLEAVIAIFREYVNSPSVSLAYQDYEQEFAGLPGKYASPLGRILLAWQAKVVVACAALRPVDERTCELKRVYVRPHARGLQMGRQLVERMIQEARAQGYATMSLDVLPEFVAARHLYESLGFVPAPAVSYNPIPGTQFLALQL
jgi:GNAT superfamily N-acetyltransferase